MRRDMRALAQVSRRDGVERVLRDGRTPGENEPMSEAPEKLSLFDAKG